MKTIAALLLFFSCLLFVAAALVQAIMGHWLYATVIYTMAIVLAILSGKIASTI